MFFVRKESIATALGAQKEFAAAQRRGIRFFTSPCPANPANKVWHYLWPRELIEPSLRVPETADAPAFDEDNPDAPQQAPAREDAFYIWSQEVCVGAAVGEPVITPISSERADPDDGEWEQHAVTLWAEATAERPETQ